MYGVASLIVTATVLPLLGLVAVCLRFFVRLRLKPSFVGIDDWLIAFSCLLVFAQAATQITAAVIGELGRDSEPTVDWRVANQGKLDYAVLVIEKFTYSCIKLGVLFFYRRIFYHHKTFRIVNNILIVIITLWGLVFIFMEAFTCGADSHHGHPCAPQEWLVLWFAITDVLGDIAVLTLPYPCIRALQMSRREKFGLSAIFMLGTLSLLFGIVRLGFVAKTFTIYFHPSKSATSHDRTPPSFWTTVEVSIGLFAACLPPLGPLITRVPSPRKMYTSVRHGFASYASGGSKLSERIPSVEHVSNVDAFDGHKMGAVKERERGVSSDEEVEMVQYGGFK